MAGRFTCDAILSHAAFRFRRDHPAKPIVPITARVNVAGSGVSAGLPPFEVGVGGTGVGSTGPPGVSGRSVPPPPGPGLLLSGGNATGGEGIGGSPLPGLSVGPPDAGGPLG